MSGGSSRVLWREQRLSGDDRGERDLTHNLFIFSLMLKNLKGIESNQQRVEVFVVAFFVASPNTRTLSRSPFYITYPNFNIKLFPHNYEMDF